MNKKTIPLNIKNYLNEYQLVETLTGRLGDEILKYQDKHQRILYLKSGEGVAAESLEQEANALTWLSNQGINIPKVINFNHQNDRAFLLITNVEGLPSHKVKNIDKEAVLKIVAEALLKLNRIKIKEADKLNTLDNDLEEIKQYISMKVIETEKFLTNNEGRGPEEIYNYLLATKKLFDNDSFTHGDYCLPNILISEKGFGLIDFGDCGMGDKYKDFSSTEVSIKRNFGAEWINVFYKYYDPKIIVNQKKIKYYQLIDQFDYCLNIEMYNRLINR